MLGGIISTFRVVVAEGRQEGALGTGVRMAYKYFVPLEAKVTVAVAEVPPPPNWLLFTVARVVPPV
jgi:hypothetical protein